MRYACAGDPCPSCGQADLVPKGNKMSCPRLECGYLQPCCDGGDLCGVTG